MKNKLHEKADIQDNTIVPSDNIYKFLAFLGLIFILLSSIVPVCILKDVEIQTINLNLEKSRLNANFNKVKYYVDSCGAYIENVKNGEPNYIGMVSNNKDREVDWMIDAPDSTNHHYLRTKKMFDEKTIELHKNLTSLKLNNKILHSLDYQKSVQIFISNVSFYLGVLFSVIGFILWYRNYQILEDINLMKGAGLKIVNKQILLSKIKTKSTYFIIIVILVFIIIYVSPIYNVYQSNWPAFRGHK